MWQRGACTPPARRNAPCWCSRRAICTCVWAGGAAARHAKRCVTAAFTSPASASVLSSAVSGAGGKPATSVKARSVSDSLRDGRQRGHCAPGARRERAPCHDAEQVPHRVRGVEAHRDALAVVQPHLHRGDGLALINTRCAVAPQHGGRHSGTGARGGSCTARVGSRPAQAATAWAAHTPACAQRLQTQRAAAPALRRARFACPPPPRAPRPRPPPPPARAGTPCVQLAISAPPRRESSNAAWGGAAHEAPRMQHTRGTWRA